MKYLLLLSALLFLSACSPKYKTLYNYNSPTTQNGKLCVKSCKEKLATCKEICKSNFDICKVKAIKKAKLQYQQKLKAYYKALETYANQVQMHNLENELYFYSDFYYPGRGYGYWGPFGPYFMWDVHPTYNIQKPKKPTLQEEIQKTELQECQIDCKCQVSYDNCFQGCGGKITQKKICIQNCPHE